MKFTLLVSIFGAACMTTTALGQWSRDPAANNPICVDSSDQSYPAMTTDGAGGAILAWTDYRNGTTSDIYAQRISAAGVPLWPEKGVPVCTAADYQTSPTVVSDGAGGAIITWQDRRNGTDVNIFAQRIGPNGNVLWTSDGVEICGQPYNQLVPIITPDGSGGAVIAWEDFRDATNWALYAQRVNASGIAQWTQDGVVICSNMGGQNLHVMTAAGTGGAIIAWTDSRVANTTTIYSQRVNSSGLVQWAADGITLSSVTGAQDFPAIVSDGNGGGIIAWADFRDNTNTYVYLQRVDQSGSLRWASDGVRVCSETGGQFYPALLADGTGGAFVSWDDYRSGVALDIYAQRVGPDGNDQWSSHGVAVCTAANAQAAIAMTTDDAGGCIVAWHDQRSSSTGYDIYAQRLNAAGTTQWATDGVPVSTARYNQQYPSIVSDGAGGAILTWNDHRNDNLAGDIYAQRIDQVGYPYVPPPRIAKVADIENDQGGRLRILWDASGWDQLPGSIVQGYIVMMGVRSTGLQGKTSATGTPSTQADAGIYWQQVTTLKASGETGYNVSVTTAADSGIHGIPWYYFKVVAQTNDPTVYWTTNVDSGYSVDNIPPAPPHSLTAAQVSGSVVLAWQHDRPSDFMWYVIYRSDSSFAGVKNPVPYDTTADSAYVDRNPPAGAKEFYLVRAEDIHGNLSDPSNEAAIVLTGIDAKSGPPKVFALDQNYPNPFNPTTEIGYQLSAISNVTLRVYDVLGREVATLVNGQENAGVYRVVFNGAGLPSGVYFYKLVAAQENGQKYTSIKKLILMK